jgi:signal transduction histidine kinase/CheY-like chemotaxis protein
LVSIILSYELLFGSDAIISRVMRDGLVIGLWLFIAAIAMLPRVILEGTWFNAGLVAIDTTLVTATIYLSGNARSELYIAYFLLVLIAASVRRLRLLLGLSLLLSAGYALVVYEHMVHAGTMAAGQLLGIPVLLVMAVFYGVALETVAVGEVEKSTLRKDVDKLKKTEVELEATKSQLETRIKELKVDLAKATVELREGQAVRWGLEQRLHDAQKMEAVGRVAARIAGEFGSLFSVIGKQTGALLSRLQPQDPLHASADELFRMGEKAATLTAQLIALSLDDRRVRQVVSIFRIVSDLQDTIGSLLPDSIELAVRLESPEAYAEIDRDGLEHILLQLVVNARDAMPSGGHLSIEVKTVEEATQSVAVTEPRKNSPYVVVQISDTGKGMNLDTQARMFDPFFSTKEANAGLGLTAVYGIVKQNGGAVEVNSRPGQGTVVRVSFPAVTAPVARQEAVPSTMLAKSGETILLVEDDEIERKLALSVLRRHNYHVLEATSSVEALMLMQQFHGKIHLAVSPLVMPQIGGRELAHRLVSRHPHMKALFVSSYDSETIQHHRINRRCVLQHPYRQAGLIEKVREVLDAA